jgi:hypothetical protein
MAPARREPDRASQIDFLMRRRLPELKLFSVAIRDRNDAFAHPDYRQGRYAEVSAYKKQLQTMPERDLVALYNEEKVKEIAELQAEAERNERTSFFNLPTSAADFEHWGKAACWTLEEAVALSFGKEPTLVNWNRIKEHSRISAFVREYSRLRDLALRAKLTQQLFDLVLPGFYVAWARRNDISFPSKLEAVVLAHGHRVADWKTEYDELEKLANETIDAANERLAAEAKKMSDLIQERETLKQKIDQLEAEHTSQPTSEKPLSTKERDTLLKLILGMAIEQYNYDPEAPRSEAFKNIHDDCAGLGLSLDTDTIRKWLKEAAQRRPRDVPT